jgi:hypothetical protein
MSFRFFKPCDKRRACVGLENLDPLLQLLKALLSRDVSHNATQKHCKSKQKPVSNLVGHMGGVGRDRSVVVAVDAASNATVFRIS